MYNLPEGQLASTDAPTNHPIRPQRLARTRRRARRRAWLLVSCLLWLGGPELAAQPQASYVRIRVVAPSSSAIPATVWVEPTTETAPRATRPPFVVTPGSTAAVELAPGTYTVLVQAVGRHDASVLVGVAPGSTTEVQVRLGTPGGAVTLALRDQADLSAQTNVGASQLRQLPSGTTAWSVLETLHPFITADRMDAGGLSSAAPTLMSAHGASWTVTSYRLDGLDVTDALNLGTPTFYPDLRVLEAVDTRDALLSAEDLGPGPVIALVPRRPGVRWTGSADLQVTPAASADALLTPPTIARYGTWIDGSLVGGGALGQSARLFASGRGTSAEWTERNSPTKLPNDVRSAYAHLVGTSGPLRSVRAVAAVTGTTRPFAGRARFTPRSIDERARDTVAQVVWEEARAAGLWSVSGGIVDSKLEVDLPPGVRGGTIERLLDGAPRTLAEIQPSSQHRWTVGINAAPSSGRLGARHRLRLGATLARRHATVTPTAQPPFAELVDGQPARVWTLAASGRSAWSAVDGAAWVNDHIDPLPGLALTTGARLDLSRASAAGSSSAIGWVHLSPRVSARWRPASSDGPSVTVGYGWYRHPLRLDWLAVGDPAATVGTFSRWDDRDGNLQPTSTELTPIGVVGLCCAAGVPNTIAPDVRRPSTAEFVIGGDVQWVGWRWGLRGIDRRGQNGIGLVNVGVTSQDFTTATVLDPGIDLAASPTPLPIYNRTLASIGRDRYALTNPAESGDSFQGLEVNIETATAARWFVRFGGTAYRAFAPGASRGFGSHENDQGLLGEVYLDPNAATSRRGRPFGDRGYIMKLAGGYEAPGGLDLAFVARYQDGQPFTRVVVAPGLIQGTDIIPAYPRGGQRFTYTLTLDARAEKRVRVGGLRLGLSVAAFNVLDTRNEVEERIVTGSAFRTVTAVQPPRALRVGLHTNF